MKLVFRNLPVDLGRTGRDLLKIENSQKKSCIKRFLSLFLFYSKMPVNHHTYENCSRKAMHEVKDKGQK